MRDAFTLPEQVVIELIDNYPLDAHLVPVEQPITTLAVAVRDEGPVYAWHDRVWWVITAADAARLPALEDASAADVAAYIANARQGGPS